MREEEEPHKRQLEELYNKQKHATQVSAAVSRKEKNRQRQNFEVMHGVLLNDLPKHSSFRKDKISCKFLPVFFNLPKCSYLTKCSEVRF
jgi:hypothetical protein